MARAFAEIDPTAITLNTATLAGRALTSEVCAVVKANGYGHGAATAAAAAIAGGATRLGVAQVQEGISLREDGFDLPIWLLSEPDPGEFVDCVRYRLEPPLYSEPGIQAAADAVRGSALSVHLMIDTGMHRVGARPEDAVSTAINLARHSGLELSSIWTHLAVADEPGNPYTNRQLDMFENILSTLEAAGLEIPLTHAANSAATIALPRSHREVVRPGIALYGMPPSAALMGMVELTPAMKLWSTVSLVKRLQAGDRLSYGLRTTLSRDANIATIPIGYADGVARRWWETGEVLIQGQRCKIVGVVTMDQIMVDCGDLPIAAGDEAVLIGRQGEEEITATEWADALGTINYEVTCGIGPRVRRI
ncbi:MAG: alanine racemase [Acidimicrobiales bacterium]